MGDDLGVGFRPELGALVLQLLAQLAEVLDDAVVHDREAVGGVRMRVAFGRPAVGRPAGMPDADRAGERLARELGFEIAQLALGAPARELAVFERGDAGGIVAAVFEPLERIDERAATGSRPRMPTIPHMRATASYADCALIIAPAKMHVGRQLDAATEITMHVSL